MAGDVSFVRDGEKFTGREFFEAIEEARNVLGDVNDISEKCQERLNRRYSNGCVSLLVQAKMNGSEAFLNLLKKEIRNRNPSPNEHDVKINLVKSAYVKGGHVITLEHYDLETN